MGAEGTKHSDSYKYIYKVNIVISKQNQNNIWYV